MENQIFCTQDGRDFHWLIFQDTSLGQLHSAIPFEQLAALFPSPSGRGAPRFFDVKGLIALQVLKAYLGLSDDKLQITGKLTTPVRNKLTRAARFRYQANVEELLFEQYRNLDATLIHRLATCDYIRKGHNVLITGSTGVGKSFLVSALGHQACQLGFRVMYANLNRLFTQLKMAKADGTYLKKIERIEKLDLLILDDFGLKPIDHRKSHLLMDILEDRHAKRSTMVAAQVPVAAWHELISNATLADAIMDRIVHQAHRIELKGESLRKRIPKN